MAVIDGEWWDSWVAHLAEGVDRNQKLRRDSSKRMKSPSSRRAWIEILRTVSAFALSKVALLAEGVDRNASDEETIRDALNVALLAEGVDRNRALAP